MSDARNGDWLLTYSGTVFYPFDPRVDEILLEDIAHHLALLCRFAGALRDFYSVAEHSVRHSFEVERRAERMGFCVHEARRLALAGLLHDGAETYFVDVPRPVKRHGDMNGYRVGERRVQELIWRRFGIAHEIHHHPLIREVDDVLLATERRDLMRPSPFAWAPLPPPLQGVITSVPWEVAERQFLQRFDDLGGVR
jgi:hypothetical protein